VARQMDICMYCMYDVNTDVWTGRAVLVLECGKAPFRQRKGSWGGNRKGQVGGEGKRQEA